MRAVLVAVGSRGDAVPFVALARRLVARGHEAVLVTHAVYAPTSPGGVEVVPIDSDPADVLSGPAAVALSRLDLRGLNRTRGVFADLVSSAAGPVAELLDGADVVVASTFATAAVTQARRAGAPVVRVQLWPERADLDGPMPIVPYSWRLPAWARRGARRGLRSIEPLLAGFEGWWERGRLRIVPHYDAGFTTTDLGSLHAYSPQLAPSAPRSGHAGADPSEVVTGWWHEQTQAHVSPRTAELLATPGPWVFVGFGSMHQARPDDLFDTVEAACRRLGVRAVLQVPGAERSGPGSVVHVIGAEPHAALMPLVRAAVHHGGSGTTSAVVRTGVPSVVVPHVADQFYWAHRLHELGAAARPLPRPLLTERSLHRRLATALRPEAARAARELASRVAAEDGTGAAVDHLESVIVER